MNVMNGFAGVLLMRKRSRNKPFGSGSCLVIVLNALVLVLTSDALSAAWFAKETPGERFRKAMKTREQMCASRKLVAGDTSCDILKLTPADVTGHTAGAFCTRYYDYLAEPQRTVY